MKRLLLILTLAAVIFGVAWCADHQPQVETHATAMQTRGPVEPTNAEWTAMLARLKQEDSRTMPTLMTAWLQSPIRVDGTIPLWGLVTVMAGGFITALVAFVILREKVNAHDALDTMRFAALARQIADSHREVREDIASLREKQ